MNKIRTIVIRKNEKPELIARGNKVITSYTWKVEGNLGKNLHEIRVIGSEALLKPINDRKRLEITAYEEDREGDKGNLEIASLKCSG